MILGAAHLVLEQHERFRPGLAAGFGWPVATPSERATMPGAGGAYPAGSPELDLAIYAPEGAVRVEVTTHATTRRDAPAGYELLLQGVDAPLADGPGDAMVGAALVASGVMRVPCRVTIDAIDGPVWVDEGSGPRTAPVGVVRSVPDLPAAVRFWEAALGVRAKAAGEGWSLHAMRAPLSSGSAVVLFVERPHAADVTSTLDAIGLVALAFVTTNIRADLGAIEDAGGVVVYGPATVVVGGVELAAAFARDPSGALVELVQPAS